MIEDLMAYIGDYGAFALAIILGASCFGVPFPTSLVLLAVGSLIAQGDMDFWTVATWGLAGAVAGDQAGYFLGRLGGPTVVEGAAARIGAADGLARARALADKWGSLGVFFSRWLVSPLGPYVNLVSGMAAFSWLRFTLWGVLGEVVWVNKYLFLGSTFSGSIQAIADILGSLSWFLVGIVVTAFLGWKLYRSLSGNAAKPRFRDHPAGR